jgi:hypothetical protein
MEQAVHHLEQAWWHYQTCYKIVLTSLIQSWYNKNVTRLTTQGCNNIVISWLYRTCWNNLATSLIISTRLLQVVNSLFQTCMLTTWDKQCEHNLLTACWQPDLLQDVRFLQGYEDLGGIKEASRESNFWLAFSYTLYWNKCLLNFICNENYFQVEALPFSNTITQKYIVLHRASSDHLRLPWTPDICSGPLWFLSLFEPTWPLKRNKVSFEKYEKYFNINTCTDILRLYMKS